ncbi:MAG: DUF5320 domain-containing protein [Candidatus Omnitrophica bacterium]|nr:DUF5320 domain-containing protein [Candidatus Omnitrophota bacterium]
MPGGDGTGPMGMGPMTGRAAGYCAGNSMPGYANPIPGRGWGRGFGKGFGRRWAAYPYAYGGPYYSAYPYGAELTAKQEADMLKDQANAMEEEIKAINDRISALEKSQGSKGDE